MTPTGFETVWFGIFGDYPRSYYDRCRRAVHVVNERYRGKRVVWKGGIYNIVKAEPGRLQLVREARYGQRKKEPFYVSLENREITENGSVLGLSDFRRTEAIEVSGASGSNDAAVVA